MSEIKLFDRIKQTSTSTGTGDFVLSGSVNGFSDFSDHYSNGEWLFYAISDGTNFEVGSGQYDAGSITNRSVFNSTNSNSAVSFSAGTKEVYASYPGQFSVFSHLEESKASGIAFWTSRHNISYSSGIVWDDQNERLGIGSSQPSYKIHLEGDNNTAQIASSGLVVGDSGINFIGPNSSYYNGPQYEPFIKTVLDPTTLVDQVFELSGVVDQGLQFRRQSPTLFFASPDADCGCVDGYPQFRAIESGDITFIPQMLDDAIADFDPYSGWYVADDTYNSGQILANDFVVFSGEHLDVTYNPAQDNVIEISAAALSGYIDAEISTISLTSVNYFPYIYFTNALKEISIGEGTNNYGYANTIKIGNHAGAGMASSTGNILIGSGAGMDAYNSNDNILIGNNIEATSGLFSSSNNVVIGKDAGFNISGVNLSVIVGNDAARNYSDGVAISAVGYGALDTSSGNGYTAAVGYQAGFNSFKCDESFIGGAFAGYNQISGYDCVTIGHSAASGTTGSFACVNIGRSAGVNSNNSTYQVNIGSQAGNNSSNASRTINIGEQAGAGSDGSNYSINIGSLAGTNFGGRDNINIGKNTGYDAAGYYNIYIGDRAGYDRNGSGNIVINQDKGTNTDSGLEWFGSNPVSPTEGDLLSIGNTITGRIAENEKYIRIGATGTGAELSGSTLSVKSQNNTDYSFEIVGKDGQTSDQMVTTTTINSSPVTNTVINNNGLVRIPSFSSTTSAASTYTAADNPGAMMMGGDKLMISNGTNWLVFEHTTTA